MSASLIRIVIVDDHPLLRDGVARSLTDSKRFEVVGEGASADDAVRLATERVPDMVLLDLSMPGGGVSAAQRIAERLPDTKIVILTVSEADEDIMAALRAGASGYVLKGVGAASLVEILQGIANGESYVSPSLAGRLLLEMKDRTARAEEKPLAGLTQRETQILRLVAEGLSNKEIARRLDLQEKTVKHHMTRVLNKLHVRNRTEAALIMRDTVEGRSRSS